MSYKGLQSWNSGRCGERGEGRETEMREEAERRLKKR